jgi:uncharacterized protein
MKKLHYIQIVLISICLYCLAPICAVANNKNGIPAKAYPPKLVNDFADILSAEQEQELERKLVSFDTSTSNQITIVTIANLGNYATISDYAYDLGNEWGVGNAKKDNGIVVLVSMAERKSRIEVGRGLEGAVPDIIGAEIVRNVLKPAFREGNYYDGLSSTVDNLIQASKNEYVGEPQPDAEAGGSFLPFLFILLLLFLFIYLMARRKRSPYYMSRGGYRGWNDPWIGGGGFIGGGNSGGGFFDGGGDSGGGFGGFGGGSFGGGGASGDW